MRVHLEPAAVRPLKFPADRKPAPRGPWNKPEATGNVDPKELVFFEVNDDMDPTKFWVVYFPKGVTDGHGATMHYYREWKNALACAKEAGKAKAGTTISPPPEYYSDKQMHEMYDLDKTRWWLRA